MRLNVRKRNGVWAVACDNAVLQWCPEGGWWAAIASCQWYVMHQFEAEIELGLRNAY